MDKKEPHWFIEFARKTNLYIGVTSLLFVCWFLRFGMEKAKYVWLSEVFGGADALEMQKKNEMAKFIPELFTAEFSCRGFLDNYLGGLGNAILKV